MAPTAEQIQALADAVSSWRTQEYIDTASYTIYVYYFLTTIDEEVSVIFPQRWNGGKMLYVITRYGVLVYITFSLSRDYRNYFIIGPVACKAMAIIYNVARWLFSLTSNASLGLCLAALLQTRKLYLLPILTLCVTPPLLSLAFGLGALIQIAPGPATSLDKALGYPCAVADIESWNEETIAYVGSEIRAYLNLVFAILLVILGFVALTVRYKGQAGRLIHVIRRDGGSYFLSLLVLRLGSAILLTPALVEIADVNSNVVALIFHSANFLLVSILSQRLMINMRKVDYMGSEPFASKLLFAPAAQGSGGSLSEASGSLDGNIELSLRKSPSAEKHGA